MGMKKEREALSLSFKLLKSTPSAILLSLVPIIFGIGLFFLVGSFFYTTVLEASKEMLVGYFKDSTLGTVLLWLIGALLTIGLYFIVSWTFVSIVTVIASPFNDMLAGKAINFYRQSKGLSLNQEDPFSFRKIILIIINELKKISLIMTLSLASFAMGLIPLLTPLSIFLSSLLLVASYMDYYWSRTNQPFGSCFKELFGSPVRNFVNGFVFLFFITVPILNLFTIPFMVIYFTMLLMARKHEA
jgi:CysZ protein